MNQMMKFGLLTTLFCVTSAAQAHAYAQPAPSSCPGYDPPPGEAYLWTGTGYNGTCYRLMSDPSDIWASWDATTGFPNDQIQSAKVGSGVYLVLFWHSFYTKDNGSPLPLTPGSYSSLNSWNRQASAARLQSFAPGSCGARSGKLVLFTNTNYGGDCTELSLGGSRPYYWDPVQMGFRNDTLSSVGNTSSLWSNLFTEVQFQGAYATLGPGAWNWNMNFGQYGYNDIISSVW